MCTKTSLLGQWDSLSKLTKVIAVYFFFGLLLLDLAMAQNEVLEEGLNVRSRSSENLRNMIQFLNENLNNKSYNRNDILQRLLKNNFFYLFESALNEKNKRDDDVPPGFIGVRGRRSRRELEDIVRTLLNNAGGNSNLLSSQAEYPLKSKMSKKSNTIAYKDGFLGVRG